MRDCPLGARVVGGDDERADAREAEPRHDARDQGGRADHAGC